MAQGRCDQPDQAVLELGGQIDVADDRLLKPVEAAGAGDHQLHRLSGDFRVAVADKREQQVLASALAVSLPEAMLLDAANENGAKLRISERLGALQDRQCDRNVSGGQSGVKRLIRCEMACQRGAQGILDRSNEAGEQSRRGKPLPLGETRPLGQQQVGRGHGKALARRRQQQPRGVAALATSVASG
jgi:hypothetical protein